MQPRAGLRNCWNLLGYGSNASFRNYMDRLLEATRRAEQRHFWFRGFRAFVRPLVAVAVAGHAAPRILDCGCGTGANLVMLGEYGRSFGFDISREGLNFAREYGQARIAHASITHIPFRDASFDLVTAFDVLYSLTEKQEAAAAQEIFRVLRPGGSLIINVAALQILRGSHSVFGSELRRSTRPRLRALLSRYGFDVQRLTYTNFVLFPLMLTVRTWQRVMGWRLRKKPAETSRCRRPCSTKRCPRCSKSKRPHYGASTCPSAAPCCASRAARQRARSGTVTK